MVHSVVFPTADAHIDSITCLVDRDGEGMAIAGTEGHLGGLFPLRQVIILAVDVMVTNPSTATVCGTTSAL